MAYQRNKNSHFSNKNLSKIKIGSDGEEYRTIENIKIKDRRFARPIILKGKYAGEEVMRRFKEDNPNCNDEVEW